jgi:phosphatidylglycerol:prolipoprotein diacylglycerol transferase
MYPYLLPEIFGYNLPMYDLLIMIGIFVMLAYLADVLKNEMEYQEKQLINY